MLRMRRNTENGCMDPVFCCDICGGSIDDIRLGAAVFPGTAPLGAVVMAAIAHKGICHDAAEILLGGYVGTGWHELSYVIQLLTDKVPENSHVLDVVAIKTEAQP